MKKRYLSLGEAWIDALYYVMTSENRVCIEDYVEVLNLQVSFIHNQLDQILEQAAGLKADIIEMRKVFFSTEDNIFGHSYYQTGNGPYGNNGTTDIVNLLKENRNSKRAALSYSPYARGKVPCINLIHFLIREQGLVVNYFSRGQDMFRKFPCDAVCIAEMAQAVALQLSVPLHAITANISSAHVYEHDFDKAKGMIERYSTIWSK